MNLLMIFLFVLLLFTLSDHTCKNSAPKTRKNEFLKIMHPRQPKPPNINQSKRTHLNYSQLSQIKILVFKISIAKTE